MRLADGWPSIHHDPANSDSTPITGARRLELAFQALDGARTVAIPAAARVTVSDGAETRVYVTASLEGSPCHLFVLDAHTGRRLWCSAELSGTAFGSTPVVTEDGRVFVGDDRRLMSFSADGDLLWSTPIEGLAISAQLASDGMLVFNTHIGLVYLLDPDNGRVLARHHLLPGRRYGGSPAELLACPQGRGGLDCPAANTPAVDEESRRIFVTLSGSANRPGELVAVEYDPMVAGSRRPVATRTLWKRGVLRGGGAASPTLSEDRRTVYTLDREGRLLALRATDGRLVWEHHTGFVSGGSPSVQDGIVIPSGGRGRTWVGAVRDAGRTAEPLWERRDLVNRGLSVQAAGGVVYVATVKAGQVSLVVLDREDGETISETPIAGAALASMGTAVGPDGWVYLTTPFDGLFALRPADR